jgi:membrane protein involved in colicin uptake
MHRTVAAMAAAIATAASLLSTPVDARGLGGGIAPPFSPIFNKPVGPDYTREQQRKPRIDIDAVRRSKARAAARGAARASARAAAIKGKRDAAARSAATEEAAIRREAAILRAKNRKLMEEKAAAAKPAEAPVTTSTTAKPAERSLEAAQAEQQSKVERLVQQLNGNAKSQPVSHTPAAPQKQVPARPGSGECTRFIPSAGMTVSVPCSE